MRLIVHLENNDSIFLKMNNIIFKNGKINFFFLESIAFTKQHFYPPLLASNVIAVEYTDIMFHNSNRPTNHFQHKFGTLALDNLGVKP